EKMLGILQVCFTGESNHRQLRVHRSLHPYSRIAVSVEATGNAHNAARLEESAGHVVGARPQQLNRLANGPGEFHRLRYVVDEETPSKATAEQGSMHLDRILRDAQPFGSFFLRGKRRLRRYPDLARVAAHICHAVHGFDRCVRLEWIFVDRINLARGGWHGSYSVTISADEEAGLIERLLHFTQEGV